jgi:uncharacterized protein (TIGR00299 family) protein
MALGAIAWWDVSAGVAGDMLLAALIDAGASVDRIRAAVDSVAPDVRLATSTARRAGLRATLLDVTAGPGSAHRTWQAVRGLLDRADLNDAVRANALAVFGRLAGAEARVHGVEPEDVHFHEVGAWDSIADIVGCCTAIHDLGIDEIYAGVVAVGSGRTATEHGDLPVPAPAVVELLAGWPVVAGGEGELATPTGAALVATLARPSTGLPAMTLNRVGIGAGHRDRPDQANVVRVLLGAPSNPRDAAAETTIRSIGTVLTANVDDLDPRLWPGVLASLMEAGADDAWLTPILMKKGRPAHQVSVLCRPESAETLRRIIFDATSTIGVRESDVRKTALARYWATVGVAGAPVRIKVAHEDGRVVQVTPEFEDVRVAAAALGWPEAAVMEIAREQAVADGLVRGAVAKPLE